MASNHRSASSVSAADAAGGRVTGDLDQRIDPAKRLLYWSEDLRGNMRIGEIAADRSRF